MFCSAQSETRSSRPTVIACSTIRVARNASGITTRPLLDTKPAFRRTDTRSSTTGAKRGQDCAAPPHRRIDSSALSPPKNRPRSLSGPPAGRYEYTAPCNRPTTYRVLIRAGGATQILAVGTDVLTTNAEPPAPAASLLAPGRSQAGLKRRPGIEGPVRQALFFQNAAPGHDPGKSGRLRSDPHSAHCNRASCA